MKKDLAGIDKAYSSDSIFASQRMAIKEWAGLKILSFGQLLKQSSRKAKDK